MTKKPTDKINNAKIAVQEFINEGGDKDLLRDDLNCALNHYANAWDYCNEELGVRYNDDAEGSFLSNIRWGGTNVWEESEKKFKIDYSHPAIVHLENVIDSFDNYSTTIPGSLISELLRIYGDDSQGWVTEVLGEDLSNELEV